MLAMAFLAALLLTIALVVMHIVSVYQKGHAIKAVNSTGRAIVDEISRSIGASQFADVSNIATYYFQRYGNAVVNGENRIVPMRGGFCTGRYTFLWNTAYAINSESNIAINANVMRYNFEYNGTDVGMISLRDRLRRGEFRLIKVLDAQRQICAQVAAALPNNNPVIEPPNALDPDNAIFDPLEMLEATENNLAIYDFRVFPAAQNTTNRQTYYSATFILATLRGGIDITSYGNYCQDHAMSSIATDFSYCAINKFNFSMRATGENREE
jgi:hypothetical protein